MIVIDDFGRMTLEQWAMMRDIHPRFSIIQTERSSVMTDFTCGAFKGVDHEPVRKKVIRCKASPATTWTVNEESENYYIVHDSLALPKRLWEEVPKRVVWRDVTKEVKDICFVHGKETVCSVNQPDFEITIKRRFEVEG